MPDRERITDEIRKATEEDMNLLIALEKECFDEPWTEKELTYEFTENPFSEIWIIEQENKPAGFLIFWKIFEQASIVRLGVLPEFRRNYCGSKLIHELKKNLKETGVEQINLEVRTHNEPAVELYRSMQFNPLQKVSNYYDNGDDAYRMICFLI